MKHVFALLTLASMASSSGALAQDALDPVVVSPDIYKVLLENEYVRVVEYRIAPGQKEAWHTHPAKAMYVVEGGRLKITLEDGTSFVAEEKTGEAHWMGPVGRHYGENIGDTPVRIVIVEVKAADATAEAEDAASLRQFAEPAE